MDMCHMYLQVCYSYHLHLSWRLCPVLIDLWMCHIFWMSTILHKRDWAVLSWIIRTVQAPCSHMHYKLYLAKCACIQKNITIAVKRKGKSLFTIHVGGAPSPHRQGDKLLPCNSSLIVQAVVNGSTAFLGWHRNLHQSWHWGCLWGGVDEICQSFQRLAWYDDADIWLQTARVKH